MGEVRLDTGVGYYYFYNSRHPLANKAGKVYVHRVVASEKEGRWITSEEHVHHIDGNRTNNEPSNIMILSSNEHSRLEMEKRGYVRKINICKVCQKETFNDFYCSDECNFIGRRKVADRPSLVRLLKDLKNSNYTQVAKIYGVSDNSIRKWLRDYGVDPKKVERPPQYIHHKES